MKMSGEGWNGDFYVEKQQALGVVNGYPWCLTCKPNNWTFEIAEDTTITPSQLPLVGFGCAGWINTMPVTQQPNIESISQHVQTMINEFNQDKLEYCAFVGCVCSDLNFGKSTQ